MRRVRGLAEWAPRPHVRALLEQVAAVLAEYRAHLPLTLRQLFYRLVGAYGYDKTEQAYGRLGEAMNRARRADIIPWSGAAVLAPSIVRRRQRRKATDKAGRHPER